ncbi:hypothetical protein IFM89_031511 [Coptis chinensis]|uniref:Helicase C-terminal domain-containing protein n=1 Tax=Coptis chinensis TaxID=261450 RepID=A0A835HL37_9MAGN|nr:hypothetical protein IFM89_031511 [Coptis chinensis]
MSLVSTINFDMPPEIENYVHRIGRTGMRGKSGIATTFVNGIQSEYTLLNLKQLLREAKQSTPPGLLELRACLITLFSLLQMLFFRLKVKFFIKHALSYLVEAVSGIGYAYCGGLGHRIPLCPKQQKNLTAVACSRRDFFGSGGYKVEI